LVLGFDARTDQVARDLFHFFRQQRGAVDLQHAQLALHLVQLEGAAFEQRAVGRLLDVRLERGARIGQRYADLARGLLHRLRGKFRHGCRR
jgi:hypothetical protein